MISKIWASTLDDYQAATKDDAGQNYIALKSLNLFIGANNTGKSRLLRKLFSATEDDTYIYAQAPAGELAAVKPTIAALSGKQSGAATSARILLECFEGKLLLIQHLTTSAIKLSDALTSFKEAGIMAPHLPANQENYAFLQQLDGMKYSSRLDIEIPRVLEALAKFQRNLLIAKKCHIPILRGMRPLSKQSDVFHQRTIKDYFKDQDNVAPNIVTGFALYESLIKLLLGQPEGRVRVKEYEDIIGQEFFGGAKITLIPEHGKDTVSVKIGEENQFPIYDLGDGLQQVIIITSACYLETEQSLFFIEEPENCLHPGLQRKLATFLLDHTEHQYLVTTHSNHLLDLAECRDDVLVHGLSKKVAVPKTTFHIRECTKDRDILAELGVKASSVYLANCTIWVEGITDRMYLRCLMEKYLEELELGPEKTKLDGFLENYHYAFIEYQGGTLGHWNFDDGDVDGAEDSGLCAIRACANALLIADGDIKNKGSREATFRSQLGDRLIILPGKEIENMLPEIIIKKTAEKIFERSKPSSKDGLDKTKLTALSQDNYMTSQEGIGYHLDTALGLPGKGKAGRKFFAEESGTIKAKVKFCKTAVEFMAETSDWMLTPELKQICKDIFAHIKSKNDN